MRIPSLDGIRAASFLVVFVAHAGLERYVPGGFGVTVFFFLSGYLITTLLRSEQERRGHVNLRHFWLRRLLRIWPAFYVVLTLAALVTLLVDFGTPLQWPALAAQLLHVTNFWTIAHTESGQPIGTGVYWSLAVEEHFYLLFPWLFIGMQRLRLDGRRQALLLWGLCALALAWRCWLVYCCHVATNRTYMGSDTRLDSILFGCALAVWHNPMLDAPAPSPGDARRWALLYVPGAMAVLAFCLVYRNDAFRETFRYSLQGAALTVLFTAAVRFPGWGAFRWLNTRAMEYIGGLSYALYLVHFTMLFVAWHFLPGWPAAATGVLALAASLLLAQLSFRYIEAPCARLRKRLAD
jgi:peptidoglycan/LPS O-acetylase OafA/YrhL